MDLATKIKSILTTWLVAMVVTLSLGETRAGDFLAADQTESRQIAASTQGSIGENYDASWYDASGYAVAPKTTGPAKFDVGSYHQMRGQVSGLDAHHVGQKAVMKNFIPDYNPNAAPSILVPKVGHTIKGPNGIVSRSTKGFDSARGVFARDIREMRRVYPDAPNSKLQELIQANKTQYPDAFTK